MGMEIMIEFFELENANDGFKELPQSAFSFKLRSPFLYESFVQQISARFPSLDSFVVLSDFGGSRSVQVLRYDNFQQLLQQQTQRSAESSGAHVVKIGGFRSQHVKPVGSLQASVPNAADSQGQFGAEEDYYYLQNFTADEHQKSHEGSGEAKLGVPRLLNMEASSGAVGSGAQPLGKQPSLPFGGQRSWRHDQHHHGQHNSFKGSRQHHHGGHHFEHPELYGGHHWGHTGFMQKRWESPSVDGRVDAQAERNVPDGNRQESTSKGGRRALARFVKHVTIEDNTVIEPGAAFEKVWRVRNDSSIPWPNGCELLAVGGESMLAEEHPGVFRLARLHAGNEGDIKVHLIAPTKPGMYKSYWRVREVNGKKFGQRLWCQIVVAGGETTSYSSDSSSSSGSSSSSSSSESDVEKKRKVKRDRKIEERKAGKKQKWRKKKQRKLERKAFKLRKKLAKIERKLLKMESRSSKKIRSNSTVMETEKKAELIDAFKVVGFDDVPEAQVVAPNISSCVSRLKEMGFPDERVHQVVDRHGSNFARCLEELAK